MILKLLALLGLNKSGFDAGMDAATKKAQKFGTDLKSQLAGGFTLAAFAALTKETIEYADSLEELGSRLGVTTRQAQEYAIAAKLGGADTEFFANKWQALIQSLGKATSMDNPFSAFGMSIEEVKSLNPREVFDRIAASIEKTGYSTAQASAMIDIFGKSSGKVANIMRDLENAKKGTLLFSDKEIAQLQRANDTLIKFGNNAKVALAKVLSVPHDIVEALVFGSAGLVPPNAVTKKRTGEGTGGVTEAQEAEARRHMDEQDELLRLERETAQINERTRVSKLTDEQRLNELLEYQATLRKNLVDVEGDDIGTAMMENALAKTESEIAGLEKKSGKRGEFSINETAFGRIGAFTGEAARAATPPEVKSSAESLKRIENALIQKGIIIRDVNR